MQEVRILRHPFVYVPLATVLVLAVVYRTVEDTAMGVLGLFAGAVLGLDALNLGMLLGALVLGVRVHRVVLGVGARVWERRKPQQLLMLRAVPVILWVSVAPGKAPVRRRMAATAGVALLFALLTVAGLTFAAIDGAPFWVAATAGAVLLVAPELRPQQTVRTTTVGWLLFRVPRLTGRAADQLTAAPMVTTAFKAAEAGDLDTAERLAAELAARYPDLPAALAVRTAVLELRGRYAEAMLLTVKLAGDRTQEPHEAAVNFAALAGIACVTVEAGQLDSETGLSTAAMALANAETLGYHTVKLLGTRALLALLTGDTARAVALAGQAAAVTDEPLVRANDLATLTAAYMAEGDNAAARVSLAKAEALVPWLPRITVLRQRLSIS
ncbi:hypothetical protein [Labedaea rhizosphaerae]|uniref:Tetratricopeptide repeat protein n=1 Tax=Labedaea rhizosphaerae TaxID=598644 RepID=A0A4R6SD78_LABRH|nr:hypothetical protein [Labedaea rhizosphaerae]TDP97577.1 hypothetical protein EV186_103541 [Labedaea rhizosphaerae]